jgi:hypothetical protein
MFVCHIICMLMKSTINNLSLGSSPSWRVVEVGDELQLEVEVGKHQKIIIARLASPPPRVTMLSRTFLQRIPRSATSISRLASSHVAAAATSPQPEMFCFQV